MNINVETYWELNEILILLNSKEILSINLEEAKYLVAKLEKAISYWHYMDEGIKEDYENTTR